MTGMMVMPANNSKGLVHYWAGKNPGCLGHIHSPGQKINFYPWLPYALDNGRFISSTKGRHWDESLFIAHLNYASSLPSPPLWVVVPDVWGDANQTLAEWEVWAPRLRAWGFPLAFAVQDGIDPKDVPTDCDVVFIGGSDNWRYPRINQYVELGKPVHVGRVNHSKYLWACHDAGVTSCDGTGWFRGDKRQLNALLHYLEFLNGSHEHEQINLIKLQKVYSAVYDDFEVDGSVWDYYSDVC
jgi:hypothetical protein